MTTENPEQSRTCYRALDADDRRRVAQFLVAASVFAVNLSASSDPDEIGESQTLTEDIRGSLKASFSGRTPDQNASAAAELLLTGGGLVCYLISAISRFDPDAAQILLDDLHAGLQLDRDLIRMTLPLVENPATGKEKTTP